MDKAFIFLLFFFSQFSFSQKLWSLEECIEYAIENNLTIEQARLNETSAQNNVQIAKNQWLPTADGYFDNSFRLANRLDANTSWYQQYLNSFGAQSSIVIFRGGWVHLNNEKATLDFESAQYQRQTNENNILLAIVSNYMNVLLNKELKTIAQANLELNQRLLDQITKMYNAGTVALSNKVQSEAEVAQSRTDLANAEIEVNRALLQLSMLLQLPDYRGFDIVTYKIRDDLEEDLYDVDEVLNTALTEQPAIKKAEIDIQSAEKNTELVKRNLSPVISGSFGIGTNYTGLFYKGFNNTNMFRQWTDNVFAVFGVNLSIPIFDRYNTRMNVQQARVNENMAQNTLEIEKQNMREQVQSAFFDSEASYKMFQASVEAVRSTELSMDFAQRSYREGVINMYDFSIAQNNYLVSVSNMIQAKYRYLFNTKLLDFYAGIPIVLDEIEE